MKQITKLKICDYTLVVLSAAVLASGIQLEVLHGRVPSWIWVHILVCTLLMMLCGWHIWLHFKRSNWLVRFSKQKSQVTRLLWWVSVITLLTGIIAMAHWIVVAGHVPVGAVHGKLGFGMILLVAGHAIKRRKFYTRR